MNVYAGVAKAVCSVISAPCADDMDECLEESGRKKMADKELLRDYVLRTALERYGTEPEYPWKSAPDYCVLRHSGSRKWYGLIMYVRRRQLGLDGGEYVDVLNVKCETAAAGSLRSQAGILPGYHMNKKSWITVLLDGSVSAGKISTLLDMSYDLTDSRGGTGDKPRITEWLVPANPKFFDIESAFEESEVIGWKQSSNIRAGDTVYMYVAAPYSAIRFKCRAVEVNIPYRYSDDNITIKKLMRIRKLEKYDKEPISLELMKTFGVFYVRGPRSMPSSLIEEIEHIYG